MTRFCWATATLCCIALPAHAQVGGPSVTKPKITPLRPGDASPMCAYPRHPRRAADSSRGSRSTEIPEVEPNNSIANAQLLPLGNGAGEDRDIDVTGEISPGSDQDTFLIKAKKGDVLGVACLGQGEMDPIVRVLDETGAFIFENDDDRGSTSLFPPRSSFPFGVADTDSALTFIVPADGDYHLRVVPFDFSSAGSYRLQIRSRRPSAESEPEPNEKQIIFLDFDGADINANAIFGFGSGNARLSPLSDFLPAWGLSLDDEDAVIDAIQAAFQENFDSLRLDTLNGDRDTDGVDGHFDIEIRNSRDDPDPFGEPNVARMIIGGTIDELGIGTIGIAQFIDPGNFSREDTAVVLLDLLSFEDNTDFLFFNSLNQFGLAGGMSKIDLVGVGVGNIAAHEAGHYLGCWHTSNGLDSNFFCSLNVTSNLMDQGGCIEEIVGVGSDFVFGTADDEDIDFVGDTYEVSERVGDGLERTDVRVAFALTTGRLSIFREIPSRDSTPLLSLSMIDIVFTRDVTGVTEASLTVNGSEATSVTGAEAGPYQFTGFAPPTGGTVSVTLSGQGIEGTGGILFPDDTWIYTIIDDTPPRVSSENPPRGSVVGELVSISVHMDELIKGVTASSLTVNGSTATNLIANSSGGDSFTFSGFAVPDLGTVTVDFSGDGVTDLAGNPFSGDSWTYLLEDRTLRLNLGGDRQIESNETMVLGGSPTVLGGEPPFIYEWTLRGNPGTMFSSDSNPVFGPAPEGVYVVRLFVTDKQENRVIGFTTMLVGEGGGTIGLTPVATPVAPDCGMTCAPNMGGLLLVLSTCYLVVIRIRGHRSHGKGSNRRPGRDW